MKAPFGYSADALRRARNGAGNGRPIASAPDSKSRAHMHVFWTMSAFILLDAILMTGFYFAGVVQSYVLVSFLCLGLLTIVMYRASIALNLHKVGRGSLIAVLSTVVVASNFLSAAFFAPQVGVLMLMSLMTVAATAAQNMPWVHTMVLSAAFGGMSVMLLRVHAGTLAMPTSTFIEQSLSATWLVLVVARSAMHNFKGMVLRKALSRQSRELAQALQHVERLATRDELTGLLNRRAMMQLLNAEAASSALKGRPYSVALFDIDKFKQVNDTLGHGVGDEVLKRFAFVMERGLRDGDQFCRFGGEEFLLLMPNQDGGSDAVKVADRLREAAQLENWSEVAPSLSVTISAGVATSHSGEPIGAVLARADDALYQAKHAGRNCVRHG